MKIGKTVNDFVKNRKGDIPWNVVAVIGAIALVAIFLVVGNTAKNEANTRTTEASQRLGQEIQSI